MAPKPLPDGDPADPIAIVAIETAYKLGERPEPKSQAAYAEEIHELRHWNKGGTGPLLAPPPGVEGHPDPRVTVTVSRVRGPHDVAKLQASLRRDHWIHVVRCYRLGAYKNPELRGWTKATATITKGGQIKAARLLDTELDDRAVADCMVEKLAAVPAPKAAGRSQAWIDMRVGPGDEPMPPPADMLVPGDGTLPVAAITAGVRAGLPAFEACYRAAFAYAPGLWGRVLLRFHVTERGKLDEAFTAGAELPDARVSQCIVHAARKLVFDKPQGGDLRFVVALRFFSDRSQHQLDAAAAPPPSARPQKANGQD